VSIVARSSRAALASEILLHARAHHLRRAWAGITASPINKLAATMTGQNPGLATPDNRAAIGASRRWKIESRRVRPSAARRVHDHKTKLTHLTIHALHAPCADSRHHGLHRVAGPRTPIGTRWPVARPRAARSAPACQEGRHREVGPDDHHKLADARRRGALAVDALARVRFSRR
jgi:hypothetical protein